MNPLNSTKVLRIAVLCLIAVIAGQTILNRCASSKIEKELMSQVQLKETELKKNRDRFNQEVSVFTAYRLTKDQLNRIADSTIHALKSQVKYFKNLASHTQVISTTADTVIVPITDTMMVVMADTVSARKFRYADQWMTLNGILFAGNAKVTYSIHNTISVDYYWQRKHWFGSKELKGTITQANPHTTTDRVIQFTVKQPPSPWYGKWWVQMIAGAAIGATAAIVITK